jgi:hypothetical protein
VLRPASEVEQHASGHKKDNREQKQDQERYHLAPSFLSLT